MELARRFRPDRARSRGRWRWLVPAVLTVVWLALGGVAGPYAGKLSEVAENDTGAFLPATAESTQVAEIQRGFSDQDAVPAVVVWEGDAPLGADAADVAAEQLARIATLDGVIAQAPPVLADDRLAVEAVVVLDASETERFEETVGALRDAVTEIDNGAVFVTGPAGFATDLGAAFAGIDGLLLLVALGVVLVILLVVYRSPILPVLVLMSSVLAFGLAALAVYALAERDVLALNGQSQGIMSILVVGAATDYALLLVARVPRGVA